MENYAEAIEAEPDFPWVYLERGRIYDSAKRWKLAARDFQKASDLIEHRPPDPEFVAIVNRLAWLRATCPDRTERDGKAAVLLAQRACELSEWKDGGVIDTLAAGYAEAGDFARAAAFQEQAMWMDGVTVGVRAEMKKRLERYREHQPFHQ